MRYCYHCGRLTPGEPLFCQNCGRTYDVKLCSRLHVNSRSAEVCSHCGSRDLSTPQPKVPLWTKAFEFFLRGVVAILSLFLGLVILLALLKGILGSPRGQLALLVLGFLALALYWLWETLPEWIRKLVRRSLGRKGHGNVR
jgi:RNA polymerase subunit RPABC4/transcription elongation factor Spt4